VEGEREFKQRWKGITNRNGTRSGIENEGKLEHKWNKNSDEN
jgi:hypothetical protein